MKKLYCVLLLLPFSYSIAQVTFSMSENKYQLNSEVTLGNNYSPEINDFWKNNAEIKAFASEHGGTINTVHIKTGQQSAVVISQGRNESVLKYKEVAFDLYNQGYDVFLIDHRGQGFSTRLGGDAYRGHVENFSYYVSDLTHFVNSLALPKHYQSRFLLSHSMGGAISALYIEKQQHPFQAAAFFSPMLGINMGGLPSFLAKIITYISDVVSSWFTDTPSYVPTGKAYQQKAFKGNPLTTSTKRYHSASQTFTDFPETQLGSPTMHWLNESLYATEEAIDNAQMINIPTILLQSGADSVVTAAQQQSFFEKISDCTEHSFVSIDSAKHELLLEQDKYRIPALTATLDFFELYKKGDVTCIK